MRCLLHRHALAAALVATACSAPPPPAARRASGQGQPPTAAEPGPTLVQVDLLASTTTLEPGASFWLAVRLRLEPGWHVYWDNPGETGLRTWATLEVPDGFVAGSARYPGPTRFESPGQVVSYGYRGETAIVFPVEAPTAAGSGEARFAARASWLACRDICVPGRGDATLALGWAGGAAAATGEDAGVAAALAGTLDRLPRPLDPAVGLEVEAEAAELRFRVAGEHDLDFFPARAAGLIETGRELRRGGGETVLRFRFRRLTGSSGAAPSGVLLLASPGGPRYYQIGADS